MFRVGREIKQDPQSRWDLSDPVFFAAGACHILTYAFLLKYPAIGYQAIWIQPNAGFTGNHIVAKRGNDVFDFLGHMPWENRFAHYERKAKRWYPGWTCNLVELPMSVLISTEKSREYDGLWLREPKDFLHDALPRAQAYVEKYKTIS